MSYLVFLLVLVVLIPLAPGMFFLKIGLGVREQSKRLASERKQVSGQLIQLSRVYRDTHLAIVSYVIDEQEYLIRRLITPAHASSWNVGMPLEVKYLPAKPKIAFLVEDTSAEAWPVFLLTAIILLGAAVILLGAVIGAFLSGTFQ